MDSPGTLFLLDNGSQLLLETYPDFKSDAFYKDLSQTKIAL